MEPPSWVVDADVGVFCSIQVSSDKKYLVVKKAHSPSDTSEVGEVLSDVGLALLLVAEYLHVTFLSDYKNSSGCAVEILRTSRFIFSIHTGDNWWTIRYITGITVKAALQCCGSVQFILSEEIILLGNEFWDKGR